MNPREIGAADYYCDDYEEIPYDDSMEAEDAYMLGDAEMKELIAEAEEYLEEC